MVNRNFFVFRLFLEECVVLIVPMLVFYQGITSAPPPTKHPNTRKQPNTTSAKPGTGGFFSLLIFVFFVGGPLLKTSLSLPFHLFPFFSPYLYLKSVVRELV